MGCHYEVQELRRGRVVGDEVSGGLADAQIQDLNAAGAFASSHFTCALGYLFGIAWTGDQNADWTVENLIHTIQHQVLVVRGQHCSGDLVPAAKY
jgi:hypothetical protein